MRPMALIPPLCGLLLLAEPPSAAAQSCVRRCAAGTPRDARGCCLKRGKRRGKPGCRKGKVLVAGHCCWPGQDWGASSRRCLGTPRCPDGTRARGGGCVAGCAAGKALVAGHCCWPGQDWGASRKACLGRPRCPAGLVPAPDNSGCQPDAGKLRWVELPEGSFRMGTTAAAPAAGAGLQVRLDRFRVTRSEVTVAQYRRCLEAGKCTTPETRLGHCNWGRAGRDQHPVNCVDHAQAGAFCRWAGGSLPSEAQWEYAARGGGQPRLYPWGAQPPGCQRVARAGAGAGCVKGGGTLPVCSRPAGRTPQGLCDMAGNVAEWVSDWYRKGYPYPDQRKNPGGPPRGKYRLYRGGDTSAPDRMLTNTARRPIIATKRWTWVGFRCISR